VTVNEPSVRSPESLIVSIQIAQLLRARSMTEIDIALSTKGFGNLPKSIYEDACTFIVGDNVYRCPSFVACFLSPRISRRQMNDPTIREFCIHTPH
jgi:hypothetical protein